MATSVFQSCVSKSTLKIANSSLKSSQATHVNTVVLVNRPNLRHRHISRKNVGRTCAQERKFTGFVEKDSAGQQNIYSVEPDVYVSDGAFSTNTKGTDGSGNGVIVISAFLAVAAVSGAAAVLFTVGRNQPLVDDVPYSGPPLSYYVQKFSSTSTPASVLEASLAAPALKVAEVFQTTVSSVASEISDTLDTTGTKKTPAPDVVGVSESPDAAIDATFETVPSTF